MEEIKGYLIKASPVLLLIMGYFAYVQWMYIDTDDAKVTAEVIPITAPVSGIIDRVSVVEQEEVASGDALAQFDDRRFVKNLKMAEAALLAAQAKLDEAEKNQAKAGISLRKNAISQEKFSQFQALQSTAASNLLAAEEKVVLAKRDLENTKIIAPQDGNISKKYIEEGSYVSKGQNLFGLVGSDTRWVIGNFSVSQIEKIKPGMSAKIKTMNSGGKSYRGEVASVVRRHTPSFDRYPPQPKGPNLSKNSSRMVVKIRLLNLTTEDKIQLQDGILVTVSITGR